MLTIDKGKSALLLMDLQQGIVDGQQEPFRSAVVANAAEALKVARAAGMLTVFVTVRLRPGYPDVSSRNKRSLASKLAGRLQECSPSVELHPSLTPREGEPLVVKRRVGAFSGTDLQVILNSHDITTLVLCGLSTSGVVLSTVRAAADMDYDLMVLEDCCSDPNREVHDMLCQGVFPSQATVVKLADFLAALS